MTEALQKFLIDPAKLSLDQLADARAQAVELEGAAREHQRTVLAEAEAGAAQRAASADQAATERAVLAERLAERRVADAQQLVGQIDAAIARERARLDEQAIAERWAKVEQMTAERERLIAQAAEQLQQAGQLMRDAQRLAREAWRTAPQRFDVRLAPELFHEHSVLAMWTAVGVRELGPESMPADRASFFDVGVLGAERVLRANDGLASVARQFTAMLRDPSLYQLQST
jgi:hypothetical protein